MAGCVFEVHAGGAHVEPLEEALRVEDATVVAPLKGLSQGRPLAGCAAELPERGGAQPAERAVET
jgi:hypothetical protein